jgi:hypothetical protein
MGRVTRIENGTSLCVTEPARYQAARRGMKRTASVVNLQRKTEQQIQPGNRVLSAFDTSSLPAAQLALEKQTQPRRNREVSSSYVKRLDIGKKKKTRRARLHWTDGMRARFALSVVQGKRIFAADD